MSPYEAVQMVQDPSWQQWIVPIVLLAAGVTAVREILAVIFGTGKRSIDKITAHLLKHERFKGINGAVAEIPDMKTAMTELAKQMCDLCEKIDKLENSHRDVALMTLGNSLTRIFHDLMGMQAFNVSMFKNFTETMDVYLALGGNGTMKGFRSALQAKWEAEIVRAGDSLGL